MTLPPPRKLSLLSFAVTFAFPFYSSVSLGFTYTPSSQVDFSDQSGFTVKTLTAEKDGWGDLVYNPLHEIEKVETDTLYQFPDDTSNLPDYFIESLEGDEIVADFEGSTLRFDIPEGQRTIAFATLSHQNKPGSLTFNGGDTGNLQVRYSTIDRGGVRMFWLSAKESALNIEANNVWLQFDVSNGTEEVMFEGAGSVSIDANNDVVLYANQLDNSKMKSLIQANAGASYDINGKNVYFLAQGESSNRGGAKPGFSGIVFAGNDLKIGSDKTEKIVFEGFDHALIIHGGENSSSVGYTVSHAEAQEIHLLGKNTSKSTGLTLDGIQDFYLKSNLLHIEGFEQSIEAKNNGFAFINTNNLNLKGNINSDTDSVISITTNSAQIQGDIVAKNAATFELKAESNVNFVGSTHSIKGSEDDKWVTLNLDLGKDSQWTLTADSDLDSLSLNNSVLSLLKKQTSLTIKKEFSGSENTFILWSNLMNQEVSQLEINNAEKAGIQYVGIQDITEGGLVDAEIQPTKFATVQNNADLTFVPITTLSERGLTLWDPKIYSEEAEDGTTQWFISQINETPGPTPTSIIDGFENNYLFWRALTDSTKERFGQLRHGEAAGVWGRVTAGSLSNDDLTNDYQTYRLGVDTDINSNLTLGVMFEVHEGQLDTHNGNGDMRALTAALYGLYVTPSECYVDAGVRFGVMDYEYKNTAMLLDEYDYNSTAVGAWVEIGKEWIIADHYTLTPHIAFNYGRFGTENFTTDNHLDTSVDSVNSTILTVGSDFGYKTDNFEFSLVADILTEMSGEQKVKISSGTTAITQTMDYSDTWAEFGLTTSYSPTKNTLIWLNGRRSAFADLDHDWRVNAGIRWSF